MRVYAPLTTEREMPRKKDIVVGIEGPNNSDRSRHVQEFAYDC